MRIMVACTAWRLVACLPHLGLAVITAGCGLHPAAAAVLAGLWLVVFLTIPVWSAMQLVRQGVAGIEIGVGGWFLSTIQVGALLIQAASAGTLGWGLAQVVNDPEGRTGNVVLVLVTLSMLLVVGALQVLLLRHAYRRWVDLVAPR